MFKKGDVVKYVGHTEATYRPENLWSLGDIVGIDMFSSPQYLVKWRDCLAKNRGGEDNAWYQDHDLILIDKSTLILTTTESYV